MCITYDVKLQFFQQLQLQSYPKLTQIMLSLFIFSRIPLALPVSRCNAYTLLLHITVWQQSNVLIYGNCFVTPSFMYNEFTNEILSVPFI